MHTVTVHKLDRMADLMKLLESNNPDDVKDAKETFHEQFNSVKESWLVHGLYDYYLSTNSTRSMEILVNVKEPHHYFLFDKITESIKGTRENMKVQGLTLLGHIVRHQPAWLYKITQHTIMKDLLKLLKNETDILPLLSALLALIVLLPIIPSLMGNYLTDVFEIFSRLASWNCNNPGKIPEEQMVHMQIALYALFLRLYGMYPCNFLAYLRDQYRMKEMTPIFAHTIKPMLNTVKMNPQLVITSKTNETSTERWKKMGAHDVIVECERFSLDVSDNYSHEPCFLSSFRSRSSTTTSTHYEPPNQLHSLKNSQITYTNDREFFSPSMILHCQTPVDDICRPIAIPHSHLQSSVETTIISSVTHISQESSSPPEAAIEATPETTPIRDNRLILNRIPVKSDVARAITNFATPTHSQPSSPMHKELSPFEIPPHGLQRLQQDRLQISGSESSSIDGVIKPKIPRMNKLVPLKIENISNYEPTERIDSPLSQEDEEVLQIVHQGELLQHSDLRQCDSVLHDHYKGIDDDLENCEQEQGSQCTSGGLHMPNTTSINNYIRRLRHHSQCTNEADKYEISTGNAVSFPNNLTVRRANSCPEMKQTPVVSAKDNMNSALNETDEDVNIEYQENKIITNGFDASNMKTTRKQKLTTSETQTENFWPMPYEHLFLEIFPSLENTESKPSPAPSPAPMFSQCEKPQSAIINDILDRYVDIAVHNVDKDHKQLQLLHQQLLFERYRREIHAFKNRRLLSDARNTRALEEHNSALKDQVQIKQKDIDDLKEQIEVLRKEKYCREKEAADNVTFWEIRCKSLQQECQKIKDKNEDLMKEMDRLKVQYEDLNNKWQHTESILLNANAEVRIAKEQATAGERGRIELEQANRELLLLGELQLKYQERFNDLPLLKRTDVELNKLVEVCKYEMKGLGSQLELKNLSLEAYRVRISELEHCIQQHDDSNSLQKRLLNEVKEECHERIKAVESKYQSQLTVNRYLEEKILELWQRCEVNAKRVISPDTSSCHEVNATLTDRTSTATGLSPHSSPLSASLASSEGSMAFTIPDMKDVKNLMGIVDQKEPVKIGEENIQTTTESSSSKLPSTSTKHD